MCDEKKIDALGVKIDELSPLITALDKNLTVTNTNLEHVRKEVTEVTQENALMRKTLYGNGNPTGGLSGRMNKVENWMENQVWFQRLLIALILAEAVTIGYLIVQHIFAS